MDVHDILLTLAEIAATFAGFSTVATVFGQNVSATTRSHLRDVAEISLSVLGMSLVPIIVGGLDISDQAIWRWGSGIAAIGWLAGWTSALLRHRAAESKSHQRLWLLRPAALLSMTGIGLLVFNAIVPTVNAATFYLMAVALLLAVVSMSFITAVFGDQD